MHAQDPVQVTLGTHHKWKGYGPTRRLQEVHDKFIYVPILKVLESLLKCPAVYEEVRVLTCAIQVLLVMPNLQFVLCPCLLFKIQKGHEQTDPEFLQDFCDSQKAKEHPLFSKHPCSLQIMLYFDEVELCNPLGSFRKKHKLGM